MQVTYIILGVILVILAYLVYSYLYSTVTTLATLQDCSTGAITLSGTTLANPTGIRFAYGVWIYVNSWQESSKLSVTNPPTTNLFYRTSTSSDTLHVGLLTGSPTLTIGFCPGNDPTVKPGTASSAASHVSNPTTIITANFPLQKWIYLTVSVDSGSYVDI